MRGWYQLLHQGNERRWVIAWALLRLAERSLHPSEGARVRAGGLVMLAAQAPRPPVATRAVVVLGWQHAGMTVFMAWSSHEVSPGTPGPWQELLVAASGLSFVDSDQRLSRVYHELKWSLPEGTSLVVAPLVSAPKLKGLAPGSQSWLRERLAPS